MARMSGANYCRTCHSVGAKVLDRRMNYVLFKCQRCGSEFIRWRDYARNRVMQ